jgi:hypothetical protein
MFEQTLKVEAYVYLVTGTALGELNHPNPLEPQKFKKRSSRHRNVKRKQDEIKRIKTSIVIPAQAGIYVFTIFIL